MKKKVTNSLDKGITLVALVVTIIVLLILAGITIALALSNNGIIQRARDASGTWENASVDEERMMGELYNDIDTHTQGYIELPGLGAGSGGSELIGIDFGGKTVSTISQGDTLRIGEDEFMVLKNSNNKIMAIAFSNLIWNDEDIRLSFFGWMDGWHWNFYQAEFAEEQYWNAREINVDMTNELNCINQYLERYDNKISGLTNNKARIEIGRYYGEDSLAPYEGLENSSGELLLDPAGMHESFWLGSTSPEISEYSENWIGLWAFNGTNFFTNDNYDGGGYGGVRPVLFINY